MREYFKRQTLRSHSIFAKSPSKGEPGTKYRYNNCGINTGGRLVKVVSGMTYADFVQTRLLGPLGMVDTTCWPNEEPAMRRAHLLRFNEEKTDLVEITKGANVSVQSRWKTRRRFKSPNRFPLC